MAGGSRFRYSVTPDLFRVIASTPGNPYLGVWVEGESGAGDFRWLHLWQYLGGSFQSVIRADVEIPDISDAALSASLQVIQSDPAEAVADGSLLWANGTTLYSYDPVAEVVASFSTFGIASRPIWNPANGWIYFLDNLSDSADLQLWRIRADMSGAVEVSSANIAANFEGTFYWLTETAFYALGQQNDSPFEFRVIGKWPLDGSAPSFQTLGSELIVPAAPIRDGLPIGEDDAVYALNAGDDETPSDVVQLGKLTGPSTLATLWPNPFAEWEDPGAAGRPMLSLSTNPERTAAIVYACLPDGGGSRGIIRVGYGVQSGVPTVLAVGSNEGTFPDFMFALG